MLNLTLTEPRNALRLGFAFHPYDDAAVDERVPQGANGCDRSEPEGVEGADLVVFPGTPGNRRSPPVSRIEERHHVPICLPSGEFLAFVDEDGRVPRGVKPKEHGGRHTRARREVTAPHNMLEEVKEQRFRTPLRRAEKIQRRAASAGFDWDDVRGITDKIREELAEVEDALAGDDTAKIEHEVGDLYFSVMNLSRFLNVDAEKSLASTNAKFVTRYDAMTKLVQADARSLEDMTLEEMDHYWERAKAAERAEKDD